MWVEDLPNGKYKFCERYLDEKTGKNKKVSVTLTSKSAQAKKQATKLLNDKIARNQIPTPEKIRFGKLIKEYIDFKKKHWAHSTYIKNYGFYKRHIKNYPEYNYMVDKMSVKDIQTIIDRVQYDKNLSALTAISIKAMIGSALKYARNQYEIPLINGFSDIFIKENTSKRTPFIDSKDIPDLIKRLRENISDLYADVVEVQILTGMRIGELRALTEDDYKDGKIHINKSIERMTNKVVKTKNNSSNRVIDSTDRIDEIFKKRIQYNHINFGDEATYIFASKHNGPITYTYLQHLLKTIDPKLSSHVFRHTHISLLAEQGFPIKYIMERVGHSNPKTTLKVYTHVSEKMTKEAKNKLNKLF
ncbi:tyrosine-type recombinase/integrase [Facklamia sp. P12934]|uniref:tyrosine-type recombinase/integrase n=1 Tax=Facklamia sp. P12934 TaxID=3421948 RepID=UPI003D174FC1